MSMFLKPRKLFIVATFGLTFVLAPELEAAGFFLPGRGVKPLGRAGTSVASSESELNSIWYNPANLASIESNKLLLDSAIVDLDYAFKRSPRVKENGELQRYETVRSKAVPQVIPQVLAGGPTANEKLSWAAGFYGPYSNGVRFPEDGPQRYMVVSNEGTIMAYLHAAIGYELTENLRLGAGLQNAFARFRIINVTNTYTGLYGGPEDPRLDGLNKITLNSFFNPTGNVGIWYQINDSFQVAASYQLPVSFSDDNAKMKKGFSEDPLLKDAELTNNTVSGGVKLPGITRAAVRLTRPSFDLEVAGVFERWSRFKRIQLQPNETRITNIPGVGKLPIQAITIPMYFQNSFSIRLGGEYQLLDDWRIRAGYGYETSATRDAYHAAILADANKHFFTGGLSWQFNKAFNLDIGGGYYAFPDRRISNSKVRQIKPLELEKELTTVVANGAYRANVVIFGLGFRYSWGQ